MYGHQLDQNTTLIDIQPLIFQQMNKLLEDIDIQDASAHSASVHPMTLNYANVGNRRDFQQKPNYQGRNQNQYQASRRNTVGARPQQQKFTGKFCRICKLAGSKKFFEHSISKCPHLTNRDWQDLHVSLRQIEINEKEDSDSEEHEPTPENEPGWDDDQ